MQDPSSGVGVAGAGKPRNCVQVGEDFHLLFEAQQFDDLFELLQPLVARHFELGALKCLVQSYRLAPPTLVDAVPRIALSGQDGLLDISFMV